MTRLICTTDVHLDAGGSALGSHDAGWGSTRLPEVAGLWQGCFDRPADGHLMLGDLTRTPSPEPRVLALAREATEGAPRTVWLQGNHDHDGSARSGLHVVASPHRGDRVIVEPALVDVAGVQVACLPWTPVQRLYGQTGGDRGVAHAAAAEGLVEIAAGLMAQADRARPVILIGHWLLAGTELATGKNVLEAHEPVVDAQALEALGFAAVLFGHNHAHQRVGDRSWVVGPPARTSWGERSQPTGFVTVDVDDTGVRVERVETPDRPMVVVDLVDGDLPDELAVPEGALVRLRASAVPSVAADIADRASDLRDRVRDRGAHLVDGPSVTVERERRRRVEALDADTDPVVALERWLGAQDDPPGDGERELALGFAREIVAG